MQYGWIYSRSQVFIWNRGQFRLDHTFDTQRASDVIFLSLGPYLVVTSDTNGLAILTRSAAGRFTTNTTLALQAPIKVERVSDENGVFVVTNRQAPGQMFIATEENITPTEIMVSTVKQSHTSVITGMNTSIIILQEGDNKHYIFFRVYLSPLLVISIPL